MIAEQIWTTKKYLGGTTGASDATTSVPELRANERTDRLAEWPTSCRDT